MKDIKKIIISLTLSLIVVILVQVIWNKSVKNDMLVYMATKDIYEGEKLYEDSFVKIKVKPNSNIIGSYKLDMTGKIAACNIAKGKIIEEGDLTGKENENSNKEYEYITIEVKNISDSLAYQLKKGDYINIYYTSKGKDVNGMVKDKTSINGLDDTSTARIFENIKVIGLYDMTGNEVLEGSQFNAIMIRVKNEEALLISNIKTCGTFSISSVK